jgi:collagenase-like PrtC family protease
VAKLRMPYDGYYVLSEMPALRESGVDTLKIQGRHLTPERLAWLVRFYRRLVDRWADGGWDGVMREWQAEIEATALGHDTVLWRSRLGMSV